MLSPSIALYPTQEKRDSAFQLHSQPGHDIMVDGITDACLKIIFMRFWRQNIVPRITRSASFRAGLGAVDPRGPIFISYRQSDGSALASDTAWAFRAAGVPVWHDRSDLLPGDTERRLAEALESGLSGAVLLVTPEIEYSKVVRDTELPQLLELEKNEAFTLSVLSAIEREPGKLDYNAPDRLLAQREGTLRRFKQEPVGTKRQRADAARAQCQRRMQAVRKDVEAAGRVVTMDVQTRIPPFATRIDADLVLRLRPPLDGARRPHYQGLDDLASFLGDLPQLVALAGAEHSTVRGGAHLSAAYAIGAALPTTLIGRVEVVDTAGNIWALTGNAPVPDEPDRLLSVEPSPVASSSTGTTVVYLDLLPTRSDSAFEDFVAENASRFTNVFHVRPIREGNLRPEEAAAIVGEASQVIRDLAGQFRSSEVHLLLRCPWGAALLLGRTLNTIRVHLYEWEDGPDGDGNSGKPTYLPSLVVRSGAGGSPIESVSLLFHT